MSNVSKRGPCKNVNVRIRRYRKSYAYKECILTSKLDQNQLKPRKLMKFKETNLLSIEPLFLYIQLGFKHFEILNKTFCLIDNGTDFKQNQ